MPAGACGTVYYTDTNKGLSYRPFTIDEHNNTIFGEGYTKLILDNQNRNPHIATLIENELEKYYEVNELVVRNHAILWIQGKNATLVAHSFKGDRTGLVHLLPTQKMLVEVVESRKGYSTAPVSYKIDAGAEITFPSTLTLLGSRCSFDGFVIGVHELRVTEGALVTFSSTSQTGVRENGSFAFVTSPGNITFGTLIVQRRSRLVFSRINDTLVLTAGVFRVKYESEVRINHGEIDSSWAWIESRARLLLEGTGYESESGPGRGFTSRDIGTGAGHGGEGGSKLASTGRWYGSIFRPLHRGSGGGNGLGRGGRGGGSLHWRVGQTLELDGVVSLKGFSGVGSNSGGGSGGSLLIECTNITGYGTVDVTGGSGSDQGGGGAGGRVAIYVRFKHKFAGVCKAFGGSGGSYGAAGTVYVEETARGPQYADIKYNKKTNKTYSVATHRFIEIDFWNQKTPWSTGLLEYNSEYYEFDEMFLTRYANLQVDHPLNSPNVTVVVHHFLGDGTGRVHLRKNQTIYVEVVESVTNESIAPCSFKIDIGAEIVFPSKVRIYGTRTIIDGRITGVHDLFISLGGIIEFSSSAQTAIVENRKYVRIDKNGNFSFGSVTVKRGSKIIFRKVNNTLTLMCGFFRVKYGGIMILNHGVIRSSFAWVESTGVVMLDGRGFKEESGPGRGTTKDGVGGGAGHGGEGAGSTGGNPYDSVYTPGKLGSGGGRGQGVGGFGGGRLLWVIGSLLQINGLVSANGLDGSGANAGGGSGGSILMLTTNMTGHGEIAVAGGKGVGSGGAGAGGRVGIHCRWRYKYGGKLTDHGGHSTVGAAAGTIYVEENLRPLEYRHLKYLKKSNTTLLAVDHTYLHVDNEGYDVPGATMLMEENTTEYEFDEMELTGHSRLLVYHPPNSTVNVTVHRFIGDKSGQFHIRDRQKIFVEIVESVTNKTEAPCSYKIDNGGEILLPAEFHVHGTRTVIEGRITGVHRLYVSRGAEMDFMSTTQTALMENKTYISISEPGNLSFAEVVVKKQGDVEFRRVTEFLRLTCNELVVKYLGKMFVNHGEIFTTFAWLDSQGVINLNGVGHGAQTGPGAGTSSGNIGTGAGYGGVGGRNGGKAYGSVYRPWQLGSGGGNGGGTGGSGGGYLVWKVSKELELNGLLTANGQDGRGQDAGGGSGGSMLIETTNMTGHGEISVLGGQGSGQGGGGAGGRVGIHCRWRYSYGGKFSDHGGQGNEYGAPAGTIYKEENYRPLQYRELKYSKTTNTSYLAVDHTYIHIDNVGFNVQGATLLMEEGTTQYEFDEMELTGYSRLLVYHPDGATNVTVVVHRFIGDGTGQFHVRENQKIYVEYVESETNRTEAPCSYRIDQFAELILPFEFHVHGVRTEIHGLLTGVHHFFVEDRGFVRISSTAQTAILENRTYVDISEPGNMSLANIIVKKGGVLDLLRQQDVLIKVTSSFFEIKYQGEVRMNHGIFFSSVADLETEGKLLLDGRGWGPGKGIGKGTVHGPYGSGAGHGGRGGSVGATGGKSYNSVFKPLELGSGGSSGYYGPGGRGKIISTILGDKNLN